MKNLQKVEEKELIRTKLKPLGHPKLKSLPKVDKALVICLDVSGSMYGLMDSGESKLHAAWQAFRAELQPRLSGWDLGIIVFGTMSEGVTWLLSPTSRVELDQLREPMPQGNTPMWKALSMAYDWIERRAKRARIIVITDGQPTDASPGEILEKANRGIPVDSIFVGTGDEASAPLFFREELAVIGERFLKKLSELTGGCFSRVTEVEKLAEAIKALSPAERPLLAQPK